MHFTEGHLDRKFAAVIAQPHELGRATHHACLARLQVASQTGRAEIPVPLGHQQRDRSSYHVLRSVAEDAFRPAVERSNYCIGRYGYDRIEGRVHNGAVALFAFS
jgi:hypothetical protein